MWWLFILGFAQAEHGMYGDGSFAYKGDDPNWGPQNIKEPVTAWAKNVIVALYQTVDPTIQKVDPPFQTNLRTGGAAYVNNKGVRRWNMHIDTKIKAGGTNHLLGESGSVGAEEAYSPKSFSHGEHSEKLLTDSTGGGAVFNLWVALEHGARQQFLVLKQSKVKAQLDKICLRAGSRLSFNLAANNEEDATWVALLAEAHRPSTHNTPYIFSGISMVHATTLQVDDPQRVSVDFRFQCPESLLEKAVTAYADHLASEKKFTEAEAILEEAKVTLEKAEQALKAAKKEAKEPEQGQEPVKLEEAKEVEKAQAAKDKADKDVEAKKDAVAAGKAKGLAANKLLEIFRVPDWYDTMTNAKDCGDHPAFLQHPPAHPLSLFKRNTRRKQDLRP